jgi:mannose/fructose/N-acetylgalactosamine-specific phosphotransferase system component IIC
VTFLQTLRKLILGETRALPIGVAVAVGIAVCARLLAGPHGWWSHAGGFVLAAMLVVALIVALPRRD